MNRNLVWGAGAALAIVTVLGISTQSHKAPAVGTRSSLESKKKASPGKTQAAALADSVCADPEKLLQGFLLTDENDVAAPDSCYSANVLQNITQKDLLDSRNRLRQRAGSLSFVIATLPDPLHTHTSLLFDRRIEAIQQAAQDAGYDYDSSWLPWETEERTFTHLADQDAIEDRKDGREDQPGIILFRIRSNKEYKPPASGDELFQKGLAVFVVGEEATHGIHRRQFQNAVAWLAMLQPCIGVCTPFTILGPSFSGSFASLGQLLASADVRSFLNYDSVSHLAGSPLRIYSGSVSGKEAVETFGALTSADPHLNGWNIHFHSFVENDDVILRDYCDYLNTLGLDPTRVAFISEDETAYGIGGIAKEHENHKVADTAYEPPPCEGAVRLFYPRDISALRAAYQAQSIFSSSTAQSSSDTPHRTLSTDLADPAGESHDTVRSYGGNQTPLAQEAQLFGIVAVLQDHRSEYLVIRSSNSLDQLFLVNFFRRTYPRGRVVVRGADNLFLSEYGSSGISGVITLSSYPLMPWDWRDWFNRNNNPTHRVFSEETVEGTYVATRFLLQEAFRASEDLLATQGSRPQTEKARPLGDDWPICQVEHGDRCFIPPNLDLHPNFTMPDYNAPFWSVPENCSRLISGPPPEQCEPYFRPATWISVMGRGDFYPLAVFSKKFDSSKHSFAHTKSTDTPIADSWIVERSTFFRIPLGMKICLLLILALAAFHAACCTNASFTAKPAFRAHFAAPVGWLPHGTWQHDALIVFASALIASIALITAWGCGAFGKASLSGLYVYWIWFFLIIALLACFGAVLASHRATQRLEQFKPDEKEETRSFAFNWRSKRLRLSIGWFLISIAVFCSVVVLFQYSLDFPNRIPTYWRSVNLNSGVSPLVPFLSLFGGLYMWFWYSLHGLALFGKDRPRLPAEQDLILKDEKGNEFPNLRMFSQEAANGTEDAAIPLELRTLKIFLVVSLIFATVAYATADGVPIRALGARRAAGVFGVLFDLCIGWLLAETWQLCIVWRKLKQLLSFLDRIALRRTMSALHGFSWGNVWKMSGNVLDVRYKLLSRQVETLSHLKASFDKFQRGSGHPDQRDAFRATTAFQAEMQSAHRAILDFAPLFAKNYDKNDFADFAKLEKFQWKMAALVGKLLTDVLIPAWRKETHSLMLEEAKSSNGDHADLKAALKHVPEHIRNAEELVCITYLGFVQNVLGRIRTMALGIVWLFVAITLSVSTYPFDPRPVLNKALIFLFLAVGAAISFVYADMHRDSTLSHVTNTTPGELGPEYWFKIIGFGLGPLVGLLAYVFPSLTDLLLSWLEPGLASLK